MVEPVTESEKSGKGHVLIVDDDPVILRMLKKKISQLGYQVSACKGSLEALSVFRSDPQAVDVVVTDMTMAEMTGDKLSGALLAIRPDIPIILCTGHNEQIDESAAYKIGIKKFVLKPVRLKEIAGIIKEVMTP